jgi:hypothetical protein
MYIAGRVDIAAVLKKMLKPRQLKCNNMRLKFVSSVQEKLRSLGV